MNEEPEKLLVAEPTVSLKPAEGQIEGPIDANGSEPLERNEPTDSHEIVRTHNGGPRTQLGKLRSSRNAIKHGIFSTANLLEGESREELESLAASLRQALHPEGMAEELLVDKLASISWRYRRFLVAEAAEIDDTIDCVIWPKYQKVNLAEFDAQVGKQIGLMSRVDHHPTILDRCLELLCDLRDQIEKTGLQYSRDMAILTRLYGENACGLRGDYSKLPVHNLGNDQDQMKIKNVNEESKRKILEGISAAIRRLEIDEEEMYAEAIYGDMLNGLDVGGLQ
jgi:hypothetical protein